MKQYPEYKDSGIEWLGEIPEGWEVIRLKYISTTITKGTTPSTIGKEFMANGIKFIRVENISDKMTITLKDCKFIDYETHNILKRSQLKENDILITIAGAIGRIAVVKKDILPANINQAVCVISLKFNKVAPKWVAYCLSSTHVKKKYDLMTVQSAQSNLSLEDVGEVTICTPILSVQETIANFLDQETIKIDTLIEKKERHIELLKELRSAMINRAVTKGLNPNAPMKDSGIEWLGKIPQHWEVSLIKYKTKVITDGAHISPEIENGVYPFISIVDIDNGKIDFDNCQLTSTKNYNMLKGQGCNPKIGDVLFSKDGTIGKTIVINKQTDFVVASSIIIIRPDLNYIIPDFINYLLQSAFVFDQIFSFVKGSALRRISILNLKKVYGIFPTIEEQYKIVEYIKSETIRIENIISKSIRQIELLQEYRTALISEVVTGKIDVRDYGPDDAKSR